MTTRPENERQTTDTKPQGMEMTQSADTDFKITMLIMCRKRLKTLGEN